MKAHGFEKFVTKLMVPVVAAVMCGLPEVAQAQQAGQQQQSGTTVDPSKGPLQPIPAQNQPADNNAQPPAESSPDVTPATPAPQPRAEQQMQQPLGAATAEGVPTVGGAASRPAGEAIAPDKQRQRRSLLLKLGLIAAAGVAVGTVAGLSKGTSAKPSGAK
jgi:hypothetical protein